MAQITQMDLMKANIEYSSQGTDNKTITKNILNEYRDSEVIRNMHEAGEYYLVRNTEIEKKTRNYEDEAGAIIQNKNLANTKSKSAQYRKSINQKVNFSLGKPFVISCENEKYLEEWTNWLSDKRRRVIKRAGKEAINKGLCFMYPWIDENGDLQVIYTIPETMYPAWADLDHTELDAMVRDYEVVEYNNQTPVTVNKVEYWDDKIFQKFIDYSRGEGTGELVDDTEGMELDENASIIRTHMTAANGEGVSWDRVPFIAFKGNEDELPMLNEMKTDIDSYDMLKSKGIDSLMDDIDAVLVVEEMSAEIGELSRARKMVQNSRIMTIDHGGSAHFEKVDANIDAIAQQLEILKKDMQDNTSTVDLTTIQLGTNPSGEAMKAFFESLNTWTNGFESEFRVMMENLKYFFDKWLSWKGGFGTFEQLQEIDVVFTLDRDIMINETGIIDNLIKLQGELSQQTRDEMNPWIEDPEKEQKRREDEEKELLKKQDLLLQQNNLDNNDNNDNNIDTNNDDEDNIDEEEE